MITLGLTGSIAMGKSTVAGLFRDEGIAVHDADAAVHRLMQPDGRAFAEIAAAFPDVIIDGAIDRKSLGRDVFKRPEKRTLLEGILHPMVREARQDWVRHHEAEGAALVVLDVPLLYETGTEKSCDAVVVVSASPWQQRRRAIIDPGRIAGCHRRSITVDTWQPGQLVQCDTSARMLITIQRNGVAGFLRDAKRGDFFSKHTGHLCAGTTLLRAQRKRILILPADRIIPRHIIGCFRH